LHRFPLVTARAGGRRQIQVESLNRGPRQTPKTKSNWRRWPSGVLCFAGRGNLRRSCGLLFGAAWPNPSMLLHASRPSAAV